MSSNTMPPASGTLLSAMPPKRETSRKQRSSSLSRNSDKQKKQLCGHWVPPAEATYPQGAAWFTPTTLPPSEKPMTFRDLCSALTEGRIPDFRPRDDFDLFATGFSDVKGTPAYVRAWVDGLHDSVLHGDFLGKKQGLDHLVKAKLEAHVDVTGLKPLPNLKAHDVVIEPIPDTPYSLRIWPGSRVLAEYCADFVETETTTPVNTPEGFEIWIRFPHFINFDPAQITSLERSMSKAEIIEGAEKYVLRDGEDCILMRASREIMSFSIPKRPDPEPMKRCAAGICPADVDSPQFGALDVDTVLYYNTSGLQDSE